MNKAYKRINWENSPSTASPLNETNLNKMDNALNVIDDRVVEIYNQKDAMALATTDAKNAATNANAAAERANTAANNANEAAQAVLDEKYILTATTEMVKSGTASPTAKGNALMEKLSADSWQGENPSPDNQQTIHSVGDMGWFDGIWKIGYLLNNQGVSQVTEKCVHSVNKIPCNAGDKITIIHDGVLSNTSEQTIDIVFYDENGTFVSRVASGASDNTLTTTAPTNADSFLFDMRDYGNGSLVDSVAHTCVKINDKYALIVDEVGKNLWSHGDKSGTRYSIHAIALEPGTYTVSAVVTTSDTDAIKSAIVFGYEDGTYKYAYLTRDTRVSTVVELTQNVNSIRVYASTNYDTSASDTFTWSDIQIEKSETASPYAPYTHNRTYIPLDEPLRGIGDVKDEIVVQDGKYGVLRKVGEYVFDGSGDENWIATTTNTSSVYRVKTNILSGLFKGNTVNALCNIGNVDLAVISYRCIDSVTFSEYSVFVYFNSFNTSDVSLWTSFLAENNMILDYELATPYYEELDQTPFHNLQSFDDVTHVSIVGLSENVEPTLAMRFPRHEDGALVTTAYCNGKKNEIRMDELTAAMLALSQE